MSESPAGFTHSKDASSDEIQQHNHLNEQLFESATINYRSELIRKAIHLCSLSIPVTYYFITKQLALQLLVPITLAFLIVDLARYYHKPTIEWFYRWFGWLLRKHEQDTQHKRLNGATYVLIASTICVLLFPKILVVTALSILIVSDTTSALVGRRFGRHPFFDKSLEGTIAFFVTAVLVVLFTPKIEGALLEYFIGVIAAAVGAAVESVPLQIDDNLTIPLSICCIMWGLYALLLPSVDLSRFV